MYNCQASEDKICGGYWKRKIEDPNQRRNKNGKIANEKTLILHVNM